MKAVNTVLGPVPVDQLGWVLMHEHVLVVNQGWELDGRHSLPMEKDLAVLAPEIAGLRQYGVKTILDATPIDLGRNLDYLVEASKRSGVNIIACTGLYKEDLWFPAYFRLRDADEIADWMVWELTEGMSGTNIKAGAIKVATSRDQIGKYEINALRGAARAHRRTGAPIITHTEGGTLAKEQLDVFEEEGVDLTRVIIGHSCGNSDLRYHMSILKRGAIMGLDRIGITMIMPDEIRRGVAMTAIAAGYASQLMFSQDTCGAYYGRMARIPDGTQRARTYAYLLTDFIPKLREAGVSEKSIDTVMGEMPRKFFGG